MRSDAKLVYQHQVFSVVLCRMLVASAISTMKVERPEAKSSDVPMRVNIWSIFPHTACCARTKLPACARHAFHGRYKAILAGRDSYLQELFDSEQNCRCFWK